MNSDCNEGQVTKTSLNVIGLPNSDLAEASQNVVTESPAEGLREPVLLKACPQAVKRDEDVSNPELFT
ncbi:MAG: hypothetical protein V3576_07695 [Candidatus Cloacimonadota bacterium]